MKLDFIPLDKLSVARTNMRGKRRTPDVSDILPTIRSRGILVPMLVRESADGEGFEIVAGKRRYTAACKVASEGGPDRPAPCAIIECGDDADAIETSMLENLARIDPDEVTQWESFVKLARAGRSVEEIADAFAFDAKTVRRILALGALLPRIRTLYRAGDIDPATVRHLTLAAKSQQKAWLALYDDEDAFCPTGHQLKAWLFGGNAVSTEHALFDVETCGLAVVSDLFGEQRFFADSDAFWTLQMEAIEARKTAYIEAGWSDAVVMERGDWFRSWEHVHAPKRKGGRVYIEVRESGEVSFHEGYLTAKEAEARSRGESGGAAGEKPKRPEATRAMNDYVGLHRHAAVRADLVHHGAVALRAMIAHVIAGAGHYRVNLEEQRTRKPEIAESVETSSAEAAFDLRRRAVLEVLGRDPDAPSVTGTVYDCPAFAPLFARLLELPDAVVLEIVAIVMGETLAVGSEAVEAIGLHIDTDMRSHWQADETFFTLLRDREVLRAMVAEVASEEIAEANHREKTKVMKTIIADHLFGRNGRDQTGPWVPRWMEFPPAAYTERGGVASVEAQARTVAAVEAAECDQAACASGAVKEPCADGDGGAPDSDTSASERQTPDDEGGSGESEVPPLAA